MFISIFVPFKLVFGNNTPFLLFTCFSGFRITFLIRTTPNSFKYIEDENTKGGTVSVRDFTGGYRDRVPGVLEHSP